MGNSEAVCKRHYLETLTREEGAAWFKIRRSKAAALNLFRWILQKLLSFVFRVLYLAGLAEPIEVEGHGKTVGRHSENQRTSPRLGFLISVVHRLFPKYSGGEQFCCEQGKVGLIKRPV